MTFERFVQMYFIMDGKKDQSNSGESNSDISHHFDQLCLLTQSVGK